MDLDLNDRARGERSESVEARGATAGAAMARTRTADGPASTSAPASSAVMEDVATELREQRESRRKAQPRGRVTAEDASRGVLETRASVFHADAERTFKPRGAWREALASVRAAKRGAAARDVSGLDWTDVDALFAYYDAVYFERTLGARVTFSWHASPADKHEEKEDDGVGARARFDESFKYCLCSDVPKWWHGANPRQLCVGVCCIVERRAAQFTRVAHLRMPDVLRRFKMTQLTKEALLHGMIHAHLFVTGHTRENAAFNAHDDAFKRHVYRINNDVLTFDVYRPPDKGYRIRWFDRARDASETDPDPSKAIAAATSDATSSARIPLLKTSMLDTLSPEHYKLLYFISKHGRIAEKATDKERWVRYVPIMVLVYEAIVAGVFEYDYAPFGEDVGEKRLTLNISQEARDNLEDLVEAGMVRSLRMSTVLGKSSMAYQPSKMGLEHMKNGGLSREDRELCDSFLYDPAGSLMKVAFDAETGTFKLISDQGFNMDSTVTESEDVSYVCSPYICRQFMKKAREPLTSYAHRASETLRGSSSIADDLDVTLSLSRVIIMVVDWIPTSCTQITELSQSLGVNDRNKGGYYSSEIDRASTDTCLELPAGLTRIKICSSNAAQYCNMEAEVEYPEAAGITQVEAFGIRYLREGDLLFGLKVEAVMTKILNDIPVDWLSRVVTDIQVDSTTLSTSMMSPYQRDLLDTVYDGDVTNRPKFSIYLAETISPKLRARHYLDGDSIEAEVKQLIGDTQFALDVTESDVVMVGECGIIFAGPECARHETLLTAFCMLRSRENFCTVLYRKLGTMKEDSLVKLRMFLDCAHDDPNMLQRAQLALSSATTDLYRVGEAIRHVEDAMKTPIIQFGEAVEGETTTSGTTMYYALNTKSAKRLRHALAIEALESTISKRIIGCVKHYKANDELLHVLRKQVTNLVRDRRQNTVAKTKATVEETRELMERVGSYDALSHGVLAWIYLGFFSFRLFDRFIGSWSVPESVAFVTKNIRYPLIWNTNAAWIFMSLGFWLAIAATSAFTMRLFGDRRDGFIEWTVSTRRVLCVNTLVRYLKLKRDVGHQQVVASDAQGSQITRVTYREMPNGIFDAYAANVTLTVDTRRGYLLKSRIRIAKSATIPGRLFPNELHDLLLGDLELNGVLTDGAITQKIRAAKAKSSPRVLLVRANGESSTREVLITSSKLTHLREKIASKFCYRVKNLVRVNLVAQIDAKNIDEEPIETDSQVASLKDLQRLNVVFYGRPKPKMAKYIHHTQTQNAREMSIKERVTLFKKKKISTTVQEMFPEPDDENDVGF